MAKTLKDFLNERQLGPMVVKNPDEQKFIDKHVVAKTADRNGNDDELFKGSKVKMADRPKHRKGYNPGEDEKVYEETEQVDEAGLVIPRRDNLVSLKQHSFGDSKLKGNQHKIDANKNGKVDAHDFHLLRKKKKVAEEAEELEELSTDTMKSYGDKRARTVFSGGRKPGQSVDAGIKMKSKQSNSLSLARTKINRVRDTGSTVLNKEEAKQIDELSQDKLMDYRAAAKKQGTDIQNKMKVGGGDWSKDGKDTDTLKKRMAGYKMAGRKVNPGLAATVGKAPRVAATEEVQIDELSTDTMKSYGDKRARTVFSGGRKPGESVDAAIDRKSKQSNSLSLARTKINRARDTGSTVLNKEEIEQIDELSHDTLRRYRMKAKSIGDNEKGDINYRAKGRELAGRKTYGGRMTGIEKAKVMAKEEADLEEKLNMDKASMGTVIKDFQKSDAPQFMGKSQKKRQVMAVAAKLTAERGKLPMNKEQRLLVKLDDLAEVHKRTMVSVFEKLNEDNQYAFMQACDTADGIEQMLDFSISYRGE